MNSAPRSRLMISSVQTRLMLLNAFYMLALGLGLGLMLFMPLIRRMQDATLTSFDRSEAGAQLLVLGTRLWPGLVLFSGLFLLHQALVSHRIVGPLYRIRATLKQVSEGVLIERMNLRPHDLLIEDEQVVNEMLTSLRERIQRSRASLDELRASVAKIESGSASGTAKSGAEWAALCASLARLESELQAFDLGSTTSAGHQAADEQASPPQALPRERADTQRA